jgi:hypothetical protein
LTTATAGTTEEHITYHEGKGGREGKEEAVSDWRISQPWVFIFESSTWFGKHASTFWRKLPLQPYNG